jgi:predicted nuclease of predicted toxin-antitoxin system
MLIKLDENMPRDLKPALQALGHDTHTVYDEGLQTRPDHEVLAAARREGRFVITQDVRLADSRAVGQHRGIMLLRIAEPSATGITSRVTWVSEHEDPRTWTNAVVIVTDSKVRIWRQKNEGT